MALLPSSLAAGDIALMKAESERQVAEVALAAAREAFSKAEEENSRLMDERLSLLVELGSLKDEVVALQEKEMLIGKRGRKRWTRAGMRSLITGMGVVPLHTALVGASPGFRTECRTP